MVVLGGTQLRQAVILVAVAFGLLVNWSLGLAAPFAFTVNSDAAEEADRLLRVDLETGLVEDVGPTGFGGIEGLSFGVDGTLYGFDDIRRMLVAISPTAGTATALAPLVDNLGLPVGLDFGLAATCDGALYVSAENTASLYRVHFDPLRLRIVGTPGALNANITAMVADYEALWGVSAGEDPQLFRINPSTGETTQVGSLNIDQSVADAGMAMDASGQLWMVIDRSLPNFDSSPIITIDRQTGRGQVVSLTTPGLESLTIRPPLCTSERLNQPHAVPTLTTAGFAILALALSLLVGRMYPSRFL